MFFQQKKFRGPSFEQPFTLRNSLSISPLLLKRSSSKPSQAHRKIAEQLQLDNLLLLLLDCCSLHVIIEMFYITNSSPGRVHCAMSPPRRVARNSQWGGLFWGSGGGAPSRRRPMGVWGRIPQLPEAGGLGANPPAAGGTGVWGLSPQRSKVLHFFLQK